MNKNAVKGFVKAAIIVGVVYAVFYYISYYRWNKINLDDVDITYHESDNVEDEKENEVNKDEYKAIYDKVKFELVESNYGEEFFDIYYNGSSFTNDYYIYLAVINLIKDENVVNCNLEKEFNKIEIAQKIDEIFGTIKYEDKSVTTKNNYLNITYDEVNGTYKVKVNNKCSGIDYSNGAIKNEYEKATILGDYLYVYEKAIYLNYTYDNNGNLVFNYHIGLTSDSPVVGNDYNSLNLDDFKSYVYKFEIDGGNYKLKSISVDK